MNTRHGLLAILFSAGLAGSALAEVSKTEILNLTKAGIDESVVLKYIEANGPVEPLGANDLIELKSAGVGDKVLAAVVGAMKPRAAAARPAPTPAPVSAPAAPPAISAGQGSVSLENQDLRDYHATIDEPSRTITVYDQGGSGRWLVSKRAPLQLTLAEGAYQIRWVGEANYVSFNVREGGTTRVRLVPVSGSSYRALTLRVTEDGQERSSGALKIFEEQAPEPQQAAVPAAIQPQAQPVSSSVVYPESRYVYLNPSPVYVGVGHVHYIGCGCPGYEVRHVHYYGCGHPGYEIHSHYDGCGHYGYSSCYNDYPSCSRYYSDYYYPSVGFSYSRSRWGGRSGSRWGFAIGF